MIDLAGFVAESNRIERIIGAWPDQIAAHERFLAALPSVDSLVLLVSVLQPDAVLRDRPGLDVRVGNFFPERGGPSIDYKLRGILASAKALTNPYATHCAYETLHPFTDGNGRSGRALWLHMMGGIERAPLGFLHHWYYQSLAAAPDR